MDDTNKDILGTLKPDGAFGKWPAKNINNGSYGKPVTTQIINKDYFVVIPAGFKDWDRIKELRQQYGGAVAKNAEVSTPDATSAPTTAESWVGDGRTTTFPTDEDTAARKGKK